MRRIDDPSAVQEMPVPEAAGAEGFFTEGVPGRTPATLVRASWLNAIQEELLAVIIAGGQVPNKNNYTQLLTALRSSGVFKTPARFDSSMKVATAEFVQQSQGNIIGHDVVGVARSLTPDDIGKALYFSAPNLIFTLPKPSDLGLSTNSGKCIHFFGFGGNTAKIVPGAGAGISFNVGTVPFIEFKPGQYLTLTAASDVVWQVIDSTAEMWRNADFAAMVSSSGYQRLPGGLIFQVGGGAQTPASGYVDVIFPIPFPNECTHVFPGYEGQGGSGSSMPTIVNAGMKTRTGCRLYTYNGNALSGGITPSYLAFGD